MPIATELIYYNNPYKTNFSASVLSIEKVTGEDSLWDVILDKTCFYPEGGGQPSDIGLIEGITVLHVFKKDGKVFHRMVLPPPSDNVECSIDWEHRFDYMQQHTGQHIISGALLLSGYSTVSVHQGENITTIEIDKANITTEELRTVESISNRIITKNLDLNSEWHADTDLEGLNLRREPKVKGQIRIVSIADFDKVACGGIHTCNTGEVECLKYISVEKIRGHARISWKIGKRVFKDYEEKTLIISSLSTTLSARPSEIPDKVGEMLSTVKEYKRKYSQLESRYTGFLVKEMFNNAEKINGVYFISGIYENESKDFLRKIVNNFDGNDKYLICLINKMADSFQWIITNAGIDFSLSKDMLKIINARGGGKAPVWQGMADNDFGIESFLQTLKTELIKV
jgi:alanyl-tRNA synthetase